MKSNSWKYYNHAFVPENPYEDPDLSIIENDKIWKRGGYLARWTTDFDCGYETDWWYVIKDSPFVFDDLGSKVRKHIRQALKKVNVCRINAEEYAQQLCQVHNNACKGYEAFCGDLFTSENFKSEKEEYDYWGAFSSETGDLIGYMLCKRSVGYVETVTSKYDPKYLKLRASDAIHYTILEEYLNEENYKFVSSGSRNISHTTNVQDYKISTFGFRKAYCRLHIEYNPKIKYVVKVIYPFRKILKMFDGIGIVHQINAVLKMEEIVRKQRKRDNERACFNNNAVL